jgi:hypothetical protein
MNVLISVLITFLVVILVLYLVNMLPLDGRAKQIVRVIVIIIGVISLLRVLEVLPAAGRVRLLPWFLPRSVANWAAAFAPPILVPHAAGRLGACHGRDRSERARDRSFLSMPRTPTARQHPLLALSWLTRQD